MIKPLFLIFLFFCSLQAFSQKLVYTSNGNITDTENHKVSPEKIRTILASNQEILDNYNSGRTKKTVGNVLLIGGFGFLTADLIHGLTASGISATPLGGGYYGLQNEKTYPTALTYIGVAAIIIAIPVKIGFSRKIEKVVTDYNNQAALGSNQFYNPKMELITNKNGIGLRLTLN